MEEQWERERENEREAEKKVERKMLGWENEEMEKEDEKYSSYAKNVPNAAKKYECTGSQILL